METVGTGGIDFARSCDSFNCRNWIKIKFGLDVGFDADNELGRSQWLDNAIRRPNFQTMLAGRCAGIASNKNNWGVAADVSLFEFPADFKTTDARQIHAQQDEIELGFLRPLHPLLTVLRRLHIAASTLQNVGHQRCRWHVRFHH